MYQGFKDTLLNVGYVGVNVPIDVNTWLRKNIKEEDIFKKVPTPHVTIKYGIMDDIRNVRKAVNLYPGKQITLCLHEISLFMLQEFDVLKVGVTSWGCEKLHNILSVYANTMPSTHLHYIPHLTLVYLNSGKGYDYVNKRNPFQGFMFKFKEVVFNTPDGVSQIIPLDVDNATRNSKS